MTEPELSQENDESSCVCKSWTVISKNARVHSEDRQVVLLQELNSLLWAFVCLSETRCLSQDSFLHGSHRFISSLSSPAASGVTVLVNANFTGFIQQKILVNDRLMAIDFKLTRKLIRIICVYLPHVGYR